MNAGLLHPADEAFAVERIQQAAKERRSTGDTEATDEHGVEPLVLAWCHASHVDLQDISGG